MPAKILTLFFTLMIRLAWAKGLTITMDSVNSGVSTCQKSRSRPYPITDLFKELKCSDYPFGIIYTNFRFSLCRQIELVLFEHMDVGRLIGLNRIVGIKHAASAATFLREGFHLAPANYTRYQPGFLGHHLPLLKNTFLEGNIPFLSDVTLATWDQSGNYRHFAYAAV